MKIGERGQVTIPKEIRDRFGLRADVEVDFRVVEGAIILEKAPRKLDFRKWTGRCAGNFAHLGYSPTSKKSVDQYIEDIRGR